MKEITILYDLPIIMTKDANFVELTRRNMAKKGYVILLPDDAVLVMPPEKSHE